MPYQITAVGAGLIGRAWSISFARAKNLVTLYDTNSDLLSSSLEMIENTLEDLAKNNFLFDQTVNEVLRRIKVSEQLENALDGADYVQESTPEDLDIKKNVFKKLDLITPKTTILASSSSAFVPSKFSSELSGKNRCLVAHPINPPYLIPAVELCPSPWTNSGILNKAQIILEEAGHSLISMSKELDGFIMNRMQGALLQEAFRLVDDGFASVQDIDKGIAQGLALRWSFMGPFETIDLNAPGGAKDYANRYGNIYKRMGSDFARAIDISGPIIDVVEEHRRQVLPKDKLRERQAWRDRRLMALAVHKHKSDKRFGK